MDEAPTPILFWVVIAVMVSIAISVIVGFAIVIRNVNTKIQTNRDMISTAVTQDEANLHKLGLELDAELNGEINKANIKTNLALQQVNTRIDKNNDVATTGIAKVQNQVNSLISGQSAFQSLSVGPAQIVRDQRGNMNFNAGPIFTVTSSNLLLALKAGSSNPYIFSSDSRSNLNLTGPGQFVAPNGGIGLGAAGISQQATGPLRMYVSNPASYIGFGFNNSNDTYTDTLKINNRAVNGTTNDTVAITGDLIVSGNVQSPYMTVLQEQIAALTATTANAQAKANMAYNIASMVAQEQHKI